MAQSSTKPETYIRKVEIFTDGACSGSRGPGGWGAVLLCNGQRREVSGGSPQTTNNRMELKAAIKALKALKYPSEVVLHSDSEILVKGMTEWIEGWKAKGWKKARGKPVLNVDLWQELEGAAGRHSVTFRWIKGHSGNQYNERADRLAVAAIPKS